jgi:pimeloyl-ACP methyl ester carboxylesterase
MGGMIAQQLTIDHPQRVRSLCSIMSNTGDRTHGLTKPMLLWRSRKLAFGAPPAEVDERIRRGVEFNRLISGPRFDEAALTAIVRAQCERSDDTIGTAHQMLAIAASPARNKALGGVTAPTLVVHGMVDPLVLPSGGRTTATCVPNAQLLMFPDMGHDLPRNRWPEIVEAMWDNAHRAC